MTVLKFILALFAAVWGFNTFYAYCAAIEKLDKEKISPRAFYAFIIFSILGFVALFLLIKLK